MLDHVTTSNQIALTLEYLPSSLYTLLKSQIPTLAQQKALAQMLLAAVAYCHHNDIMHRDLKPANCLVTAEGILKICDFGQARMICRIKEVHEGNEGWYTHGVASRWYRAPELLYGSTKYDESIDIWSVGCIIAELTIRRPLLQGESDIDQLYRILKLLGTPNNESWPVSEFIVCSHMYLILR